MQTRKKSISLHALGVIPSVPRGSAAHRSNSNSSNPSSASTPSSDSHPSKRLKRSHTLSSDPSTSTTNAASSPQRRRNVSASLDRQRLPPFAQTTPPPSPGDFQLGKIDFSGIGDDIVVGVLRQLEATGNRPHQIKELATALLGSIRSVDSSSNPVAIISSRLTNYLRRPWTALAPCPLAKEQVNIHPRRVYYFLTTCPRQEMPDYVDAPMKSLTRIISPSISSGPEEEDASNQEAPQEAERVERSPSPDLDDFDLTDLNMHPMAGVSFGESNHAHYGSLTSSYMDSRRDVSPPLEHDEREFTQTATSMANRASTSASQSVASLVKDGTDSPAPLSVSAKADSPDEMLDVVETESEEVMAQRNQEAASALFGHGNGSMHLAVSSHPAFGSSPMLRPSTGKEVQFKTPSSRRFDDLSVSTTFANDFSAWSDLKSPEAIGLSELDDMLGGF